MPAYPIPHDEQERLLALERCKVLDTPPERIFDDVVQLASQLCGTPIALVSLIDRSRQWFKARVGLDMLETSRGSSLCAHAIVAKGPMVVRDALVDPRFASNPLVTGPTHIRFYAAVPLVVDDFALGTVCVMDRVPRELSPTQIESLVTLARRTSAELLLRSHARGSPSYMAPEQMLSAADVDVRSDVWSLGIVLYELLAGRPPFGGPTRLEVCSNVLVSPLPPLVEARPDVPPALALVVARCLEKRAELRYQTVRELRSALSGVLEHANR